jgi:glycosyltransferase involved in cell wall biosynthesis
MSDHTQKKITVQFVLPSTGGKNIGGMEMVAADLLHRLNPDRYQGSLICLNRENAVIPRIDSSLVKVHVLEKMHGIDPFMIPRLTLHFLRTRPSIVHTFNEGALLYALPAAKLARVPALIHAEHGRLPVKERPLLRATRIRMTKAANHVVVVSESLRRLLVDDERVDENNISVVINGVDTKRFDVPQNEDELRKSFHVAPNDFVVGTVGSLTVQKNHELLIRAAAKIPDLKVLIAGAGPLESNLKSLIKELNVADKVHLVGQLNDVPGFLAVLDAFVLSSLTEATSIALLEAMAARLPAIVTDVGGNPAVIGDAGFLVPSENIESMSEKLKWCKDHREECKATGLLARQRVEIHYSMDATVKEYERIFENALLRKQCGGRQ